MKKTQVCFNQTLKKKWLHSLGRDKGMVLFDYTISSFVMLELLDLEKIIYIFLIYWLFLWRKMPYY